MDFGQNLIARNSGVVRVGDEVEILATAPAKAYGATTVDDSVTPDKHPDASVTIDWQGKPSAGIINRYYWNSWRIRDSYSVFLPGWYLWLLPDTFAGRRSKSAEKSAMGDDGTILSCSCVPKTALRLEN